MELVSGPSGQIEASVYYNASSWTGITLQVDKHLKSKAALKLKLLRIVGLPADTKVSVFRYSKSRDAFVHMKGRAEFDALMRSLRVKSRYGFYLDTTGASRDPIPPARVYRLISSRQPAAAAPATDDKETADVANSAEVEQEDDLIDTAPEKAPKSPKSPDISPPQYEDSFPDPEPEAPEEEHNWTRTTFTSAGCQPGSSRTFAWASTAEAAADPISVSAHAGPALTGSLFGVQAAPICGGNVFGSQGGPPTGLFGSQGGPPTGLFGSQGGPPTGLFGSQGGPPAGFFGSGRFEPLRNPNAPSSRPRPSSSNNPYAAQHNAVCDMCDSMIVGDRFKCFNCRDYDLCSSCFPKRFDGHNKHVFVRVHTPSDIFHPDLPPHCDDLSQRGPVPATVVYACNGSLCMEKGNRVITGPRFTCNRCPGKDFCAECMPVHADHHTSSGLWHHWTRYAHGGACAEPLVRISRANAVGDPVSNLRKVGSSLKTKGAQGLGTWTTTFEYTGQSRLARGTVFQLAFESLPQVVTVVLDMNVDPMSTFAIYNMPSSDGWIFSVDFNVEKPRRRGHCSKHKDRASRSRAETSSVDLGKVGSIVSSVISATTFLGQQLGADKDKAAKFETAVEEITKTIGKIALTVQSIHDAVQPKPQAAQEEPRTAPVSTPAKDDSSEKDYESLLQMTMSEYELEKAAFESEMASELAEYHATSASSNDSAPEVMTSQLEKHPTEPTSQQSDKPEGSSAQQSRRPSSYQDDALADEEFASASQSRTLDVPIEDSEVYSSAQEDEAQSTVEDPRKGSTLSDHLDEVEQTEQTETHSEQDQADAEYYSGNQSTESVMVFPTMPKESPSVSPELSVTSDLSFGNKFHADFVGTPSKSYPDTIEDVVEGELLSSADEEGWDEAEFSDDFVHVNPESFSDWSQSTSSLGDLAADYPVLN